MMGLRTTVRILALLFFIMGCGAIGGKPNPDDVKKEKIQNAISFTGTVVYLNFEGGFWGIIADDGQRYDPIDLPKDLQKEGLRVEGKIRPRRDVAHFHMWGNIVEILELRKITGTE